MLIYLSGGMSKFGVENFDEGNEWRVYFKEMFDGFKKAVRVFNPNDHFSFLKDPSTYTDREAFEYDLYQLRRSDLMIVNFNDPESKGTGMEIAIAHDRRIPILGLCENGEEENLYPIYKEFCERIFTHRSFLAAYIMQHYTRI